MVAKLWGSHLTHYMCYLLAKIHMVAKHRRESYKAVKGYLLAKIHMVAKPSSIALFIVASLSSSKNPYGSKTLVLREYHSF